MMKQLNLKPRRRTFCSGPNDNMITSYNNQNCDSINAKYSLFQTIPGQIPRISCDTMADILRGKFNKYYDHTSIIDYRFDYEYEGGHIKNAIWLSDISKLQEMFFEKPRAKELIIFHCEFSQNRGPEVANTLREIDRRINIASYPFLYYPDVYILNGGYSLFYQKYPTLCEGGYTPMFEKTHRKNGDLVKSNSFYRNSLKLLKTSLSLSSSLLMKETFSSSPRPEEEEELSPLSSGRLLAFCN